MGENRPEGVIKMKTTHYDHDFVAWTVHQATLLRQGKWEHLDGENLAEEIESLGKRDRRQLESRVERLMQHLLKWRYQPEERGRGWRTPAIRVVATQRRGWRVHASQSLSVDAAQDCAPLGGLGWPLVTPPAGGECRRYEQEQETNRYQG